MLVVCVHALAEFLCSTLLVTGMILNEQSIMYLESLAMDANSPRTLSDHSLLAINKQVKKAKQESPDFCLLKHADQFDKFFLPTRIKYMISIVLWNASAKHQNFVNYHDIFRTSESMCGLRKYSTWFQMWKRQNNPNEIPDHKCIVIPAQDHRKPEPYPGYYNEPRCHAFRTPIWSAEDKFFKDYRYIFIR